jgi:hypothetical protein
MRYRSAAVRLAGLQTAAAPGGVLAAHGRRCGASPTCGETTRSRPLGEPCPHASGSGSSVGGRRLTVGSRLRRTTEEFANGAVRAFHRGAVRRRGLAVVLPRQGRQTRFRRFRRNKAAFGSGTLRVIPNFQMIANPQQHDFLRYEPIQAIREGLPINEVLACA